MPGAFPTSPGSNIGTPMRGLLGLSSELDREVRPLTPRQAVVGPDDQRRPRRHRNGRPGNESVRARRLRLLEQAEDTKTRPRKFAPLPAPCAVMF
jgi:hypothetical protein